MQKQIRDMVAAEIANKETALKDAVRKELMEEEPFKTIIAQGKIPTAELMSAVC